MIVLSPGPAPLTTSSSRALTLRPCHEMGLIPRQIGEGLQVSHSTVGDVTKRTSGVALGLPLPDFVSRDDDVCGLRRRDCGDKGGTTTT